MRTDGPAGSRDIVAPRELVLASAGTGKTYALSSRMIGLMARGAPPDALLASTFTRKAAGEILNRVLTRLAEATLFEDRARTLAEDIGLSGESVDSGLFSEVLKRVVKNLHRVNVGTLDSLFVRIAGSFAGDLGLPPDWFISDETTAHRLESEALQEVLSSSGPAEMAELVRMTMRGESGRGVLHRLLNHLREVRSLLHQHGSSKQEGLWVPPDPGPGVPGAWGSRGSNEPAPSWVEVLRKLAEAPLPTTARGDADSRFASAVEKAIHDLQAQDWDAFCTRGLGAKVLGGEDTFHGKEIPPELRIAASLALVRVAEAVREELRDQGEALRVLVTAYQEALSTSQRRAGAFRFEDITFLLSGERPTTCRSDLWYRLDQQAHHLLLDEFQDTSRPQWEALEPLAQELLTGDRERRSALIVADPKQSIYGWRGAEPSLAVEVGVRFGLTERSLHRSWRSSKVVLDLVNQVFSALPRNPIWKTETGLEDAVTAWAEAFQTHQAARSYPGYVRFEVGPSDEGRGSDRPNLMAWAAGRIEELHRQAPWASIGVLVRRNAAVARLITHLRRLGLDASEEGATALTDSPSVSTSLALLYLADHPGDSVVRYQVALSPLGALVGLTDPKDHDGARDVALDLRRRCGTHGYGPVLSEWTRELRAMGALDDREVARMEQLAELGYRWDSRSTLRPEDFVHFVEHEAMEAPSDARVRVMTVHKAKGLEFDIVVLPELDLRLTTGRGLSQAVLPLRDPGSGEVTRIFPALNRAQQRLFPELAAAGQQSRERELLDAMGVVYVAITRARYALYLFTGAASERAGGGLPFTPAGLLRGALCPAKPADREGEVLFHHGSETWWRVVEDHRRAEKVQERRTEEGTDSLFQDLPIPWKPAGATSRRFLSHRSPSSLAVGHGADVRRILRLEGRDARRRGILVHAWMERMVWIEDWSVEPETLLAQGRAVLPDLSAEESEEVRRRLLRWLSAPEIRDRLRRVTYPEGSVVLTEEPFAVRLEDALYQGRMDRVVLVPGGSTPDEAEVLDFKTDAIDPAHSDRLGKAAETYREQLEVYRRAVAAAYRIPLERVRGTLVFLAAGQAVESHP